MWIKIIDRTHAQKKTKKTKKPIQLQLKFENVPATLPNKRYSSIPFKPVINGSDPYTVTLTIDKPTISNPKQLALDAIDLVPLAFADKIYIKIPSIYIVIAILVVLFFLAIGFIIGRIV